MGVTRPHFCFTLPRSFSSPLAMVIHGSLRRLTATAAQCRQLTCRHTPLANMAGGVAQCPDCHKKLLITWVRIGCNQCGQQRKATYSGWGSIKPKHPICPQCQHPDWAPTYRHQCNYFTARGALKQMLPLETLATQSACMPSSPQTSAWVG